MAVDFEATQKLTENYAADIKSIMNVDKVILFGSYAKGNATELSDIDICFFFERFQWKKSC